MIKNIIRTAKKEYFKFKFIHFENEFFTAISLNKSDEVISLLKQGVNVDFQDNNNNTALHIAALHNLPDMVNLLLTHKANPNLSNTNNDTPLILICGKYQRPPEGETYDDQWHNKVSKKACPIIQALVNAGAHIETMNKQEDVPLVLAIRNNYNQGAKYLIAAGANALQRDGNSVCALGAALTWKKMDIVEYIYTHAKDSQQIDGFAEVNSLYPGTKNDFLPLLNKMKLKLSLDIQLPESKKFHKLGKI